MNKLNNAIINLKVEKKQMAFYFLGGSTIAVKNHEGTILYVDPCFSNSGNEILSYLGYIKTDWQRLIEIPIKPEEVTTDVIITSHDHLDHYDVFTIPGIDKKSKPIFVGPSSCHYKMREQKIDEKRIVELNPGDKKFVKGYEIEAFAADHTPDCIGFVTTYDGIRSCFMPEAKYSDALKDRIVSFKFIDILFIGANGKYGAVTPEEGAKITCELEPSVAIPIHYGLYAETNEDPETFVDAVRKTCGKKNIKTEILNFKEPPFIYKK
jgi:L-ascorbate 6-phosphate lactonase